VAADPSIGRAAGAERPLFELESRAAGRLYDRHHRRVHAFCLAQLRNGDEAADASQTTFVHALAALQRGVEPTFELPWLLAIARNVCRSRWEARRRRRHLEVVVDPHDLAELAPAPEPTDRLAGIDDALAELPELQRQAVLLRDWHGLAYKEVAEELGISLAAAETLIFRGRATLARELTADEAPTQRSGLGSLLGLFKSAVLGGGPAAKLAVGAAVVAGVGVAGTRELVRPLPAPPKQHAQFVPAAAPEAAPAATAAPAHLLAVRTPTLAARPAANPRTHAVRHGTKPSTTEHRAGRHPARPPSAAAPTVVAPIVVAPIVVAPAAGAATAPPTAPAGPRTAPAAAPAPTAPAATAPAAAAPTPVAAAAVPKAPAPAPPTAPVTDATKPVVTTVTETVQPVVTTVTDTTVPVVTSVTNAAQPVVTTATDAAQPVVTTVTDAVAPVVTTVTSALPPLPLPPPLHLP
jgi:RNA polymerase sigma factor (sigma-70 family)